MFYPKTKGKSDYKLCQVLETESMYVYELISSLKISSFCVRVGNENGIRIVVSHKQKASLSRYVLFKNNRNYVKCLSSKWHVKNVFQNNIYKYTR